MRNPLVLAAGALLLAAGPAMPQSAQNGQPLPIATVTCADIANVPKAYQAALIYYAAGYRDGVDYARSTETTAVNAASQLPVEISPSSPSSEASASSAESSAQSSASSAASSSSAASGGSGTPIVGGLVLQVQDVIAACTGAPQAFLTDIIADHGGARGYQGSPSASGQITAAPAPASGAGASASQPAASSGTGQAPNALAIPADSSAAPPASPTNAPAPPPAASSSP